MCREKTQDTQAQDSTSGENQGHSIAIGQDDKNNQAKYTPDEGGSITGAA
jgi:hypothetical protein